MGSKYEQGSFVNYDYTTAYREHGNGKYLGPHETFENIVAKDQLILEEYGVTHEEIGNSLRRILNSHNTFNYYRLPELQSPVPGIQLGCQIYELGSEPSPYLPEVSSDKTWYFFVDGMDNGNKAWHPKDGPTIVSDMLPEMIGKLGFFEGEVYFGIDPEWAISIHTMVKDKEIQPYIPKYENTAWEVFRHFAGYIDGGEHSSHRSRDAWKKAGKPYPVDDILKNAFHHEVLPNNLHAYVAPGDLNLILDPWKNGYYSDTKDQFDTMRKNSYWGLFAATQDTVLPLDTTFLGMPLDARSGQFKKGDISIMRVWPYAPSLVG